MQLVLTALQARPAAPGHEAPSPPAAPIRSLLLRSSRMEHPIEDLPQQASRPSQPRAVRRPRQERLAQSLPAGQGSASLLSRLHGGGEGPRGAATAAAGASTAERRTDEWMYSSELRVVEDLTELSEEEIGTLAEELAGGVAARGGLPAGVEEGRRGAEGAGEDRGGGEGVSSSAAAGWGERAGGAADSGRSDGADEPPAAGLETEAVSSSGGGQGGGGGGAPGSSDEAAAAGSRGGEGDGAVTTGSGGATS